MNAQSIFDTVRRPAVWITILATLVVAGVWYFAWMSPEGNKLNSENSQIGTLRSTLAELTSTLKEYQNNQQNLGVYNNLLNVFSTAVPPEEDAGTLTNDVAALANNTAVTLTELNVPSTATPIETSTGTPTGLYAIPIAISLSGTWAQCSKFLQGIYTFPRLITIQTFTPTPQLTTTGSSSIDAINPPPNTPYVFSLTGTAYFSAAVSGQVASTSTTVAP
jgi:Tfp pilus assembly protein PilO